MCTYSTHGRGGVEVGALALNIERLVSGWSEGMGFTAELVLMECVTTGSRDTVSD